MKIKKQFSSIHSLTRMNKKGFELTITTLVLIIIAILVLAVLIYGFGFGWSVFWNKITAFSGGKDNAESVKQSCTIACDTEKSYDYCQLLRKVILNDVEQKSTCNDLEDTLNFNCEAIVC
ncbi:hypothetical protein J4456_04890 [Candidatus Pacearchaeota archaeon]|nr:hypothetical protein [Candidatus Pacearchaeota archaeon]